MTTSDGKVRRLWELCEADNDPTSAQWQQGAADAMHEAADHIEALDALLAERDKEIAVAHLVVEEARRNEVRAESERDSLRAENARLMEERDFCFIDAVELRRVLTMIRNSIRDHACIGGPELAALDAALALGERQQEGEK
jgi:hypothetical protein